jgi:hypothetical protein
VIAITDLMTEAATDRQARVIYKGTICAPGWLEWDGAKFHDAAQNGAQLKFMNGLFLEFSI